MQVRKLRSLAYWSAFVTSQIFGVLVALWKTDVDKRGFAHRLCIMSFQHPDERARVSACGQWKCVSKACFTCICVIVSHRDYRACDSRLGTLMFIGLASLTSIFTLVFKHMEDRELCESCAHLPTCSRDPESPCDKSDSTSHTSDVSLWRL